MRLLACLLLFLGGLALAPAAQVRIQEDDRVAPGMQGQADISQVYIYNGSLWKRLTFGQAVGSLSLPVVIASDQTLTTVQTPGASAVVTSVADAATVQTLLAANSARLGASFWGESTATLYVKLGAGATTASFTFKVFPQTWYELPFRYTGLVTGIWDSDTAGSVLVTEVTP